MDEKAVRGILWTMLTFGATKVIGVLTTIALARMLAPTDFGLFALATLGTGLLSIFNGNWLGATLIVKHDLDERARGTVLTLLIASGAAMAACLAAVAPLAADAFGQPRLQGILFVFAGILLFSGVNWFYEMVMQRELAFHRRFATQVLRTLTFSVVALVLGAHGAGVWSLVAAHFAGHVVNGVSLFTLAPYRIRPAFERHRAREIARGSRGFLGQELAEFFEQNADYIAIGQVLGASQLGYYSMAYRQADLPRVAIADPLATVTFPAFAQMRHRGEDVGPPFLTGLRMVCLVTCPIGIALSAAAVPFVEAVFGSKWLPMAAPLTVLGIWALARPLQVTIGRLLNSLGAAWLYGRISVRCLLPFAVGTVLAAHLVGIAGVGCVLLAYILVIGVLLMRVVARVAGVPVRAQWRALGPMFLAAAVSWAATRAVAEALHAASPVLALAVCVATCLATYALMLLLVDRSVLRTAMQQTRRLATPKRAAPATPHRDVDQRRGRRRKPIGSMSVLHAMTRRSRP